MSSLVGGVKNPGKNSLSFLGRPSPYLHHLLTDVDDAEPVQELGEALQFGIALLQGHLPLAGQLPAEILHQFALEKKGKPSRDFPPTDSRSSALSLPHPKILSQNAPAAKSIEVWCPRGNFPPQIPFIRSFTPKPALGSRSGGGEPWGPPRGL